MTCGCQSRRDAMRAGEMVYSGAVRRWYWPLHFLFSVWPLAQARFAWPFCPFCGADLPDTDPLPKSQPDATGGSEGEWE
jgi:hypothetical protein